MKCQLLFLQGEEYGWTTLVDDWLHRDKSLSAGSFFQHEMIFADFNVRGKACFRKRDHSITFLTA